MPEFFDLLHRLMRYSHITCGFVGLALFWIPIFAVKGSRLHVRCGRVFTYLAFYVGTTGLIASMWCLSHPSSFVGTEWATISQAEIPYVAETLRFMFAILGFLSVGVLSGVVYGVRAVRSRHDHSVLGSPWLYASLSAFGVWSLGLAIFGAWNLTMMYAGRHLLPVQASGRYWIPVVLGLLGVLGATSDFGYVFKPRPSRMAWWYKHMENMLGVGIGFHTAFLVFGASRFLPLQLHGAWQLVPWVLPAAVGIPATHCWIRYYKRKFGELDSPASSNASTPASLTDGDEGQSPQLQKSVVNEP
jgi:hypothetical protein